MMLLSTYLPAAEDQAVFDYCEHAIEGYFIDPERVDTIYLRSKPSDPDDEPYDCSDGFNLRRDPLSNWSLYYLTSDPGSKKVAIIDSDILNNTDYAEIIEVCRDPETGLDQLLLTLTLGGVSNGDASDVLFVFYDKQEKHFSSLQLGSQFVDNTCSARATWQRYQRFEEKNRRGDELYQSLRPPVADANRFVPRDLPNFNLDQVNALFADLNRDENFTPWQAGTWLGIQQEFYVDVLAENEFWRIMSVYSERGPGVSWGVLLLEDKRSGRWKSFYDVPHEYSSKVFLFLPHDAELDGNLLQLQLCTDCSFWGEYSPFQVNLETFEYEQLPASMP
jgi:hypothetical protein